MSGHWWFSAKSGEYIAASLTVRPANLSVPLQRLYWWRYSTKALMSDCISSSQATPCLHWLFFFSAKNKRKGGFLHAVKTHSLHYKPQSLMQLYIPAFTLPPNHICLSAFYMKIMLFRKPNVYVRPKSTRPFYLYRFCWTIKSEFIISINICVYIIYI